MKPRAMRKQVAQAHNRAAAHLRKAHNAMKRATRIKAKVRQRRG